MNALSSVPTTSKLPQHGDDACLRLDQCAKNKRARIVALLPQPLYGNQDERVTLRLKELGFLPGVTLNVIGFGLLGHDPIAVQINGSKFALRQAEAAKVLIELLE